MTTFQRVATANMYDSALRNLAARQKSVADLQENLTAGKRVVRASDDPVAAAQAERALTRISRIQAEQRQLEVQRGSMALAESTLGDAVGLVQEMRQLIVGAGNGTFKPEDRRTVANQLTSLRDQFNEVINRKDTNGAPLLGALGSALQAFAGPLLGGGADYQFNGLPGQAASSGTDIATALDGHAALMFDAVRDGVYAAKVTRQPEQPGQSASSLGTSAITTTNRQTLDGASYSLKITAVDTDAATGSVSITYDLTRTDRAGNTSTSSGNASSAAKGQPIAIEIEEGTPPVSVMKFDLTGTPVVDDSVDLMPSPSLMSTLDAAIRGITEAKDTVDAAQAVSQALANIDAGMERLHNIRGYAGELLNRADRIASDQETRSIQLEGDRSRAEDLDMIQGISDFQNANVGYQAALQSYAQVQRMTLLDFMR